MDSYDSVLLILFFGQQIHTAVEEECLGSIYRAGKSAGYY